MIQTNNNTVWKKYPLDKLGDYFNGRAFKKDEWKKDGLPIIRIQNLNNRAANFNYTDKSFDQKYKVESGDLLVSWAASLGVYMWDRGDAWLNQHIFKVIPNGDLVTKDFLFYLLKSVLAELYSKTHGTGIVHITKEDFDSHEVYIPDIPRQEYIVKKLNSVLPLVDESHIRIEQAKEKLNKFRQAILSAAISGKLTEEWREEKGEYDWERTTLIRILKNKPRNGYSPKPVNFPTRVKSLTLSATTSGYFNPEHFKYIDEDIDSNSHLWLKPDDILIQRGNSLELVGVSAVYDGKEKEFIYPDLMMKIQVNERALSDFVYYVLSEQHARNYFRDNATGTSGNMPKINQPTVMNTPILLPSIEEQQEIITKVKSNLEIAKQIEINIQNAEMIILKLEQSILSKAFRHNYEQS